MLLPILQSIFERDLIKLKTEISSYGDESKLWRVEKSITNSAGNLCLHLMGNLNTYIGAEFGNTGYIRNRELEFAKKGVSKQDLETGIDATALVVKESLNKLSDADLLLDYPQIILGQKLTTGLFLVHLATHLTYHLGQINYHRRLIDS
jgi:uncharacterized damage-inducible protein DinB